MRVYKAAAGWMMVSAWAAGTAWAQPVRWESTEGPRSGLTLRGIDAEGVDRAACGPFNVYVSMDRGPWSEITGDLPAAVGQFAIGVEMHRGVVFAVLSNTTVWRHDGGGHWVDVTGPARANGATRLTSDGTTLYMLGNPFAGATEFLFKTEDLGANWTTLDVPDGEFPGDVRYEGGVLWLPRLISDGYVRSVDGGETWAASGPDAPQHLMSGVAVIDGAILVPEEDRVYRSTDAGATWTSSPSTGFQSASLRQRVLNVGTVMLGMYQQGEPGLYRSTDLGATWARADQGLPNCIEGFLEEAVVHDGVVSIATGSGVYESTDAGQTWAPANAGMTKASVTDLAGGDDRVWAILRPRARAFTLQGSDWTESTAGFAACAQPISLYGEGQRVIIATAYDGLYRSTDGGATFTPFNAGMPTYNGTAGGQVREIASFVKHRGRIFAGSGGGIEFFNGAFQLTGGGMVRLNDAGTTWQRANRGFPSIGRNGAGQLVYDPVESVGDGGTALMAATLFTGMMRSTDLGDTWTQANAGMPIASNGSRVSIGGFARVGDAVLAASHGFSFQISEDGQDTGVFRSVDDGLTWSRAEGLPLGVPVTDVEAIDGVAYAAAGEVYRSFDQGMTWRPLTGAPPEAVGKLAVSAGVLYATVGDEGVWRAVPGCTADFNGDSFVDFFDYESFVACFEGAACPDGRTADLNDDGFADVFDYVDFVDAFEAGC